MLKIGNITLASPLILAPMAGISDLPFRTLNRRFGFSLAFIEMINARSLSHKSKKTQSMLSTDPFDKPLGIQLLGCEEKFILKALDVLKNYKFDVLDFNAACPAKKVTRRGEGASLLKEPKKLHRLLELLVKKSGVPVTVKIRSGWDKDSINAREVALYCEDAGVKALFIHGRSKNQGYSGKVDYKTIKTVKQALAVPVIASGDILSAVLAKKTLDETGCDGLLVARGALGNPWIFKEAQELIDNGQDIPKPAQSEVIKIILEHLDLCIRFYGEKIGVVIFRKFISWYTKGFRKIRPLREKASHIKTKNDLDRLIMEFISMG